VSSRENQDPHNGRMDLVPRARRPAGFYGGLLLLVFALTAACSGEIPAPVKNPSVTLPAVVQAAPIYTYEIVNSFPHDPGAWTQGLDIDNGILYEGTGIYGRSSIRKVDLATGRVLQVYNLPPQYYCEGITIYKDTIIQLTLESGKGFVYDKNSLALLREFPYSTQGWGVTHDGDHIIMSDGTSVLRLLDPGTFKTVGQIEVHDVDGPVERINELEYFDGRIYANIWQTDNIAIIDPKSGQVTGWINLSGLLDTRDDAKPADVLNGIAYDADTGHLYVTGKLWSYLFEIKPVAR